MKESSSDPLAEFDMDLYSSVEIEGITFTAFQHAYDSFPVQEKPRIEDHIIVRLAGSGKYIGMMTPTTDGKEAQLITHEISPELVIRKFTTLKEAAHYIASELLIHKL